METLQNFQRAQILVGTTSAYVIYRFWLHVHPRESQPVPSVFCNQLYCSKTKLKISFHQQLPQASFRFVICTQSWIMVKTLRMKNSRLSGSYMTIKFFIRIQSQIPWNPWHAGCIRSHCFMASGTPKKAQKMHSRAWPWSSQRSSRSQRALLSLVVHAGIRWLPSSSQDILSILLRKQKVKSRFCRRNIRWAGTLPGIKQPTTDRTCVGCRITWYLTYKDRSDSASLPFFHSARGGYSAPSIK